jgi:hypothetical protein
MDHRAGEHRLLLEAPERIATQRATEVQGLERNRDRQLLVPCLVHFARAPASEERLDAIATADQRLRRELRMERRLSDRGQERRAERRAHRRAGLEEVSDQAEALEEGAHFGHQDGIVAAGGGKEGVPLGGRTVESGREELGDSLPGHTSWQYAQ